MPSCIIGNHISISHLFNFQKRKKRKTVTNIHTYVYNGPSHLSGQKNFQVPKNEIFHTENRFLGTLNFFLTG